MSVLAKLIAGQTKMWTDFNNKNNKCEVELNNEINKMAIKQILFNIMNEKHKVPNSFIYKTRLE